MTDIRIGVVGIPGKWSTEVLADALEARTGFRRVIDMGRVTLDLQSGALLHEDESGVEDLCGLDGLAIKKISEIYAPDALDRLEMLRFAERRGVHMCSRPERILRLMDRLACTVTLAASGAPMPPTRITEDPVVALRAVQDYGAAVFKPLFSTKARGMCVIEAGSSDPAARIAAFAADNPVMYIQQKADLSGQDLGMVFLAGEYLCTYARVSTSDSWNTTIHSGGKYAPYQPDAGLIELARKAQAPFELDFTTVDVALTPDGPIIFEVSAFGGYRGVLEGCGLDAAAMMADHILARVTT